MPTRNKTTGRHQLSGARAQRAAKALELRTQGWTLRQIATTLDISISTTQDDIARALRETVQQPADELRQVELEKLDRLERAANEVLARSYDLYANNGKNTGEIDPRPKLGAIDRLVRIAERRARLLGLDAPQQVEHLPIQITVNGIDMGQV